jgi:hypothetical protein
MPRVLSLAAILTLSSLLALSSSACVREPAHVATGKASGSGRETGAWQSTQARCGRASDPKAASGRDASDRSPVVLVFSAERNGRARDTVIEIPYEPTPAHVDVVVAPSSFTFTRRACNEFEAHVDGQEIEGVPGTFARGSLRLSCPVPDREGTFDVVVDFEQC